MQITQGNGTIVGDAAQIHGVPASRSGALAPWHHPRITARFAGQSKTHDIVGGKTVATWTKIAVLGVLASICLGRVIPGGWHPFVLKGIGGMVVLGILGLLARRCPTPGEVILFFAFVLWAVVSALVVAVDVDLALRHAWTVFQMGLVFWGVTLAHVRAPDLRIIMWGFWGIGVVAVVASILDPDSLAIIAGDNAESQRLGPLGENPNFVGETLLFAILAALYLLHRRSPRLVKAAVACSVPSFFVLLLYTGSRKMSVAVIMALLVWSVISIASRKLSARTKGVSMLTVLAIAVGMVLVSVRWEESPMARRWELELHGHEGGSVVRKQLAKQGLELFLQHPIAGVGLLNQVIVMGYAAHSDFVDVLASTGVVGAALYFPIYLVAFRRARRLRHLQPATTTIEWRAFVTYLAMMAWLMFGFTRFNDPFNLVALGGFVGFFSHGRIGQRSLRPGHRRYGARQVDFFGRG